MEPQVVILGAALLQWVVVAVVALFKRIPRTLVASTLILAAAFVNGFGVRRAGAALTASVVTPHAEGSCAAIDAGMAADVVRAKMGQPYEVRDDAKTRGPGAVTWVYRDSRCAVHLLEEKVELVE